MGVRERIVACAREHIGDPYNTEASYPRTGPASDYDSFNCSGLTRAVYDECGLTIPSWQGAQNGEGSQSDWVRRNNHWTTEPDELRPGDLVFFGSSPSYTTHVGISLGGTRMIDSVPDGGVQERTLQDNFVGGGWPLPELPEDGWILLPTKGTVEVDRTMNIRDYPSTTEGSVVDTYEAGDAFNIDGIVLNDGYTWAHYIGASSGKDRFVAMSGDTLFVRAVMA